MKKILTVIMGLILSVCCFTLTACSTNVCGTYKFKSMSGDMNGMKIDVSVGEKLMGMITLTEDYMMLDVKEDGTCVLTLAGENNPGKWEKDGDKLKVSVDGGEERSFIIEGKSIYIENDGVKIVLSK